MSTTPNNFDDAAKYILLTLYLGEGFTEQYTQAVLNKQFENPKLAIALQALQQLYLTHRNAELEQLLKARVPYLIDDARELEGKTIIWAVPVFAIQSLMKKGE